MDTGRSGSFSSPSKNAATREDPCVEQKTASTVSKPTTALFGYYSCIIIIAAFMVHLIADGITYAYGVLVPTLLEVFNEGEAAIGSVGSTMYGLTMFMGPIAAALSRHFGCRATSCAGAFIAAFGAAIGALSKNATVLLLTFGIVTGFGFGLIYLPAVVSVAVWFDRHRALAMGITVCGSGLGTVVFSPLMQLLIEVYDWRGTLLILSGVILNCAVFGALLRAPPTKQQGSQKVPKKAAHFPSKFQLDNVLSRCRAFLDENFDILLLKDWAFICFLVSTFLTGVAYPVPFIYSVDRAESLGMDRNLSPWILSAIGFAGIPGRLGFGALGDLPHVNRLWLFNSVIIASGGAMVGTIGCFDLASNIVCAVVYGLTMGACTALTPIIVADLFGIERVDTAFGDVILVQGVGSLLGPPIAGALKMFTGSYVSTFITFGTVMAVSGLMLFIIPTLQSMQQRAQSKTAAPTGGVKEELPGAALALPEVPQLHAS